MRAALATRSSIAVFLAVFMALQIGPAPASAASPGGGPPIQVGPDAELATLVIYPNGSVSTAGILGVNGHVYTLLAPYAGTIADERNQSVLDGNNQTLSCTACNWAIYVYRAVNVTVEDFVVISTGSGVEIAQSSDVRLLENTISAALGHGVDVYDSSEVLVANATAPGTFGFYASNVSSLRVEGSDFSNSMADGIEVHSSSNVVLEGNDATHAALESLYFYAVYRSMVTANQLGGSLSGTSVVLDHSSQSNVSFNDLAGSSYPLNVLLSDSVSLWTNNVSQGAVVGIYTDTSSNVVVGDTVAFGTTYAGAQLEGSYRVSLLGVDFRNGRSAVLAEQCVGLDIENSLLGSGVDAVTLHYTSNVTIRGSDLTNPNNGVVASNSSRIVIEDSDLSRSNYPIYLTEHTDNVLVTRSNLSGAQLGAVYTDNASHVTIDNSSLRGAALFAVSATHTLDLTVAASDLSGTPSNPRPLGVSTVADVGLVLRDDTITWTDHPYVDVGSTGIDISGTDFSNATNGWYGIDLSSDSGISIRTSDFRYDTGVGIALYFSSDATVSDCHLDHVWADGITASHVRGLFVTGNTFDQDGDVGMYADTSLGIVATGNSANDLFYGFFFNGVSSITVANNVARNDSGSSIAASSGTAVTVSGNDFSNDTDPGALAIALSDVLEFSVTGNDLTRDSLGLYVVGTSVGTVAANRFVDTNASFWIDGFVSADIYHNDFLRAGDWHLYDLGATTWNRPYPVGGNFWSNFTGPDARTGAGQNLPGSDGIVDVPFTFPGSTGDQYPLATAWADHEVVFVEGGLPAQTSWGVIFNGTPRATFSNSITVLSTVGAVSSYGYSVIGVPGYTVTPSSGAGVIGAGAITILLTFTLFSSPPPTTTFYIVHFEGPGLPVGTDWSVVVSGTLVTPLGTVSSITLRSTNFSIPCQLANGTFSFVVMPVPGYTTTAWSGSGAVAGANVTVVIPFQAVTYAVTVVEAGLVLSSGSGAVPSWSVTIGNMSALGTGTRATADLVNGTYPITPSPVAGYTVTPSLTDIVLQGGPVIVYIVYTPVAPTGTGPTPLPNLSPAQTTTLYWGLIGAIAALAAAGWFVAFYRRGRRGPNATTAVPPSEPPRTDPPPPSPR